MRNALRLGGMRLSLRDGRGRYAPVFEHFGTGNIGQRHDRLVLMAFDGLRLLVERQPAYDCHANHHGDTGQDNDNIACSVRLRTPTM